MDAGLLLQYVVVGVAIVASLAYVIRQQFPAAVKRARINVAMRLLRDGRPAWQGRLGRRIAPPASVAGPSCGSCSGCGPGDREH